MAEHLGIPQVSYVVDASYQDSLWKVRRETEEGFEDLEVDGKCLLTVLASAFNPRYMSVKGIVEAYSKEVETWGADRIDVDPAALGLKGSPTRVKEAFAKSLKSAGKTYEVDSSEAVDLIIDGLKDKFII